MQIFKTALSFKTVVGFHTDYGSTGISPPTQSSVFPPPPLNFVSPSKVFTPTELFRKTIDQYKSLTLTLYFFKINISLVLVLQYQFVLQHS